MLELNKILVIIEPDGDSEVVLEKTVQLAKYAESKVELMTGEHNTYLENEY